ncbi:MAG TPA: hypothetical protein VME47_04140 [Acetobacteraceae bacterium]|nr:hypothetical protein [Acetobacteraceae bacterium]
MAAHDRTHQERRHDEAVEDSFPASDPPANSGIVGPRGPHAHGRAAPHRRNDDARPKGTPTDERHATETAYVWEDEIHPPGRR